MTDISIDDRAVVLAILNDLGIPVPVSNINPLPGAVVGSSASGTLQTLPTSVAVGATVVKNTFPAPVSQVVVNVRGGGATPDADEILALTFGAPNDTVAAAWLDSTTTGQRVYVKASDGPQLFTFNSATITDVHMQGQGTTPDLDVSLEGYSK